MRRRPVLALAIVLCLSAGAGADAAETPARAVVEALHDTLLAVMKEADSLGFGGRRDRLAPVFAALYDTPVIARAATGRYWKRFDAAQREPLIGAIGRLSVATYAARFDGYSGERFRSVSQRPGPRGTVLVNTELIKSNGEAVALNYLLRKTGTGWRIIDVYLEGKYSELAVRRSEYTAIIKRKGLGGLFAAIEEKIAGYESGAPK